MKTIWKALVAAIALMAVGCSGAHGEDQSAAVAREALTAADIFGFEDPTGWSTTTAGVVLTKSTTHSQGSFSIQVKPSSSNGFTPLASTALSTLVGVSPTLAWDVMLPTTQPNPNFFGTAQTYVNCPSRGINSVFLGQVELTGKPLNVWNTVTFPLTNALITSLLQGGYTDLTITVVINVPVPTTGLYRIDNLRFVPLAANACGGRPNGTSCTDGNACTVADTCQAGACHVGAAVVCQASDQCHSAGVCNTATGACSNPQQVDGTACSDGNGCTQTDACQAGVCTGSNPVACTASDACHVAGTCVPATGACTSPPAADGTTCNDQNACTATSACQSGVCTGSNATACPPLDQCHVGLCDPASGACGFAPAANGTACNDGNSCTSGDTCQSGVCGGPRDPLCGIVPRFEELVDLGGGARVAIFSYRNAGAATVGAPYGTSNVISVDGVTVATPAHKIESFGPGDHPGALAYPLPAGATNISWTLGAVVATANTPAQPLGTTGTGAPGVTVHDAAGNPVTVAFDTANADVTPTVILTLSPAAISVAQGRTAETTLNVERVGGFSDPLSLSFAGESGLTLSPLPIGTEPISAYTLVVSAQQIAALGPQQVHITATSVDDQPLVILTVTVTAPPVSSVSLVSLSMKAPLTMQGVQSWAGFANIVQDNPPAIVEPFLNYTSTPLPPFLSDPNAPRWVKGNGFTVQDNLGLPTGVSGVPKVIVESSQVSFEVGVELTDDTSALEMTANAEALDNPLFDPLNVGTGTKSCKSNLFPSVVEGNHGKYTVRIERWQDGATNCPAAEQLDPDYPLDSVTFDGPSPDAFTGCWVPLGSASKDLYSSQPLPDIKGAGINGPTAPKDGTFSGIMTVPVQLPAIATYLRYVVKLEEADTRVPNDTEVVGWGPGRLYPNALACQTWAGFITTPFTPQSTPTTGQGYACSIINNQNSINWSASAPFCPPAVPVVVLPGQNENEGPLATWRYTRPAVMGSPQQQTFVYEQASSPFHVVVEPIAIAQLKVLPLTILYQPPGDKSSATYTLSRSFGTTMTASNLVDQSQSTEVDSKATDGTSVEGSASLDSLGGPGKVGNLLKAIAPSIGLKAASSTTWDQTTSLETGRSSEAAQSNTGTFESIMTTTIGPIASLVPGAAGTFDQEPFWGDTFVTLVHPQVGVWKVDAGSAIILLGADGAPSSPSLFSVTVRDLDECARQVAPHQNGIAINTSTHTPPDSSDVLDANDCLQLLQLDPFYGAGQRLPTAPNARVVLPQNLVISTNYGTNMSGQTLSQKLSNTITYSNVSTATNTATYNAKVTDALESTDSGSVSLSAFGFSFEPSFSGTLGTTHANEWKVTFESSFAATVQSSIGIEGDLADDHPSAQFPAAFVFQDAAFGGFIFQDKDAPPAP